MHDPRMLYSDVIPPERIPHASASSQVNLIYNIGDNDGDVTSHVLILNSTPRPCYGVKKIEIASDRVSMSDSQLWMKGRE